jgi:hypothetical protein
MPLEQIAIESGETPGTLLTKEDFDVLNHGSGLPDYLVAIQRMRTRYSGNQLAQKQIDIFDPSHLYRTKWIEYSKTLPNTAGRTELELWFKANGYSDPRLDVDREGVQRIMGRAKKFRP